MCKVFDCFVLSEKSNFIFYGRNTKILKNKVSFLYKYVVLILFFLLVVSILL